MKDHKYWSAEIERALKRQKTDWTDRADKVIERYRGDKGKGQKQFNLLWSNTETLKPALYSQTPVALVSRRFKDQDPVARSASEILERATEYAIDAYDFDGVIQNCVEDVLLPGRCQVKVNYKPYFGDPIELEDGATGPEEVLYEEVTCKYFFWRDFVHSKARSWQEVTWCAFRSYLTKSQAVKRFGTKADKITFAEDESQLTDNDNKPRKSAGIWEIWDKAERKVYWWADGPESLLDEDDPPLNLQGFFPCPEPLFAVKTNDSMTPIPEFTLYQDQADEIDELSARIELLVKALGVKGVYNAEIEGLQQLVEEQDENSLIPVNEWAMFAEKGGLKGAVDFFPTAEIAQTAIALYEARERTKQELYEVTGLADIIRGASDAGETATAQRIKGQFASLRLRDRQKRLQKFVRDVIRLKAEIIAEHFQPQTLTLMTNQQVTPEVMELLRNDSHRRFRIDIETDSTIEADEESDKRSRIEFMEAAGGFLEKMLPVAQNAPALAPFLGKMLMFGVRGFRAGRELEAELEQALDQMAQQAAQPKEPPPDPKALKMQHDAAMDEKEFQLETMKTVREDQRAQQEHEVEIAKEISGAD